MWECAGGWGWECVGVDGVDVGVGVDGVDVGVLMLVS